MELRLLGVPVLLLVPEDETPPQSLTPLEDWMRFPSTDPSEMAARLAILRERAIPTWQAPQVDHGIITTGDAWVSLSPVAERLATALSSRFGLLVPSDDLLSIGWPGTGSSARNLHVAMRRLRLQVETIGLDVRTIMAKGYVMDWSLG